VASMYLGNGMLLLLNLPLIGFWVRLLKVPYRVLFPLIILFTIVGSYSIGGNKYDILVMLIMGGVGYLMRKFDYEAAPFIFTFVLGSMFEEKLRQSLLYSSGSFLVFVQRPISAAFVFVAFILLMSPLLSIALKKKIAGPEQAEKPVLFPRRYDIWSGGFLLIFALCYMWEAVELGISTARTPAPGFFPLVLGSFLVLLSLILLTTSCLGKKPGKPLHGLWHGMRWQKTILILASLTAYAFLLEPLGYLIATLALMIYLFKGIEPQKWRVAITGAVLSSGVTYILFKTLLQIQLPRGIFNLG